MVIYVKNVGRALKTGMPDIGPAVGHLTQIMETPPSADPKSNRSLFEALVGLANNYPDVLESGLAKATANRTIDYLAAGNDEDYGVFRKCLARLSPQDRVATIKSLENRCFRQVAGDRTKLLGTVTEDVRS